MSYCLNPDCSNPNNATQGEICQSCGSPLRLRDRYRIVQPLGQGGFGATYLSIDESLPGHPNCVIKQLRPTVNAPQVLQMARELFDREAQTLGRIGNHPQVPRLLDFFEVNQEFYLVQEYVSGSTLQQEVKRDGKISEHGVKQILSEILPLLEYIHSNRVIHRDIKPANIIRRSQDNRLVLIDFGAVKYQTPPEANASEHTAFTAYAIGTPGFAPPEQMAMRPVPASDIYALGVTCIYLLTGKSPKDLDYDPTTGELLWQRRVDISDHFVSVLKKMLEVSVKHRYQTANEIFRSLDLEPYLDSLTNAMLSSKPGTKGDQRNGDYRPDPLAGDMPSSPTSPAARAAMAIRARQNRADAASMQSGTTRGRSLAAQMGANASMRSKDSAGQGKHGAGQATGQTTGQTGQPKGMADRVPGSASGGSAARAVPARLDAEGLQTYYTKGKRDFSAHDLKGLSLPRANLAGAAFNQANLSRTNLQGANLANADLGRTNLSRANLRDANLVKAYLSNADLEGADLRGADLSAAYLLNANLRGANLCGANLSGAKLTEEQLALARINWMTVRPSGRRGVW
jgi:serine/threonine protein kinase, bacterial